MGSLYAVQSDFYFILLLSGTQEYEHPFKMTKRGKRKRNLYYIMVVFIQKKR